MVRFDWIERMGVHYAYHQSLLNRVVHWICIPIELGAVLGLLSVVDVGPVDAGLVAVALIGALYCTAELFLGLLWSVQLVAIWFVASTLLADLGLWAIVASSAAFAVTFTIQLVLGHRIGENGRDDTARNLSCASMSKNPVPILLIFFYHFVEVALIAGYRPTVRARVDDATRRELARLDASNGDPNFAC
ncbi:hypothetical protein C5142_19820 [Rhodococcus sp. BGS-1C]|uniref:hypothetical protein n=1 Tax=unclassified Rhodococcus (in: high G+C Gram-positive bacteria) TaxID=192944 RepID=UPI0019D152A8|nr:hypothetical protein [Rhodococcus sp. KRD197]